MSSASTGPHAVLPVDLPPAMHIFLLSEGIVISKALYIAAELGVADLLADGAKNIDELARSTAMHPRSLYRVLRLLASVGVFTETQAGQFALTAPGQLLRSGTPDSMRSWVRMVGLPPWHKVYAASLESVRTGKPVFQQAVGMELFEYLRENLSEAEVFNAAMSDFSRRVAAAVVLAYDFTGARTLVDVGGGHGTLVATVLRAHPEMTGVIFDLPHVVEGAPQTLADAGVTGRCQIAGGDFFQSVPAGGDVYVLSWVIHDWDFARAIALLENCRRAMNDTTRLLVVEAVVPPGDALHPSKFVDFVMLIGLGGQERTQEEYATLLNEAGFRLARVIPTSSPMSVLECFPV